LEIYGQRWEQFVPAEIVKDNLPNDQLANVYAGGHFVLNDHWASMRDFGIISNRVFDVVGCGGRLVSDSIPRSPRPLAELSRWWTIRKEEGPCRTVAASRPGAASLGSGTGTCASQFRRPCTGDDAADQDEAGRTRHRAPRSIGTGPQSAAPAYRAFVATGKRWPTSSAFIRLIAPLTTDYAATKLELVYLQDGSDPQLKECDICIVQRIAVRDDTEADLLLERLERLCIPLFVDTDDAFSFHEKHMADDLVLKRLMGRARGLVLDRGALAEAYSELQVPKRVIPNNLDPRFWRNYRQPVKTSFDAPKVRFLYMGTVTHEQDFLSVLPAFERLGEEMPDRFELTLIGAVRIRPNILG
ncbi:hypothetical protein ACFSHQ_28050, partial [Gemmobacter lanyuensis]